MAFAASNPKALPYHHPAWASTLSETYGFRGFVLALLSGDRITAGLPVLEARRPFGRPRWISLPFTDACAPLHDGATEVALLEAVAAAARDADVAQVEIRADVDAPGAERRLVAVQHGLALERDPEAVLRSFHKSQVRANIQRAERGAISLRRAERMGDVSEAFYDLHTRARRRQGIPVQPRRFFQRLWTHVLQPGLGFCLLAEAESRVIAGAVFLTWNGTTTYKYGASNPDYLPLRPNHLLFWHAIRWACEEGFHTFDFGRTDLDHSSLRTFKKHWGTREEPLYYSALGGDPGGPPSRRALAAMSAVIQHSPLFVTRALGDLLYRFTA